MKQLLVQRFLENHTFKELEDQHGVFANFSKSGHKFSLNYDMTLSKENDPLAQECRGLILSLEDGRPVFGVARPNGKIDRGNIEPGKTKVLAFPMRRFFNYGQGACANVNWSDPNLAIQSKIDGTLSIIYFDPFTNLWCMATRGVPEADLLMDNGIFTFRALFEKALHDTALLTFDQFTSGLDKDCTYCFELATPLNRIVVNYSNNTITFLAVRSLITGNEFDPKSLYEDDRQVEVFIGIPLAQEYKYTTIPELLDWVSSLNPSAHEGVVVRDSNYNRIKVKNPAYVAASKMRDSLGASPRNCLELILLGKDDDAISLLPKEIVDNLLSIKRGYVQWLRAQEDLYVRVYAEASAILPGDKKAFALTLDKYGGAYRAAFFNVFSDKADSIRDYIDKCKKDGSYPSVLLDNILSNLS